METMTHRGVCYIFRRALQPSDLFSVTTSDVQRRLGMVSDFGIFYQAQEVRYLFMPLIRTSIFLNAMLASYLELSAGGLFCRGSQPTITPRISSERWDKSRAGNLGEVQ